MKFPLRSIVPMIKQPDALNIPLSFREYILFNWRALTAGGLVLLAFFYCYAGVLSALAKQWRSNDVYSYGFLIPLISAYLIWIHRDKFMHVEPSPNYLGGIVVLLSGMAMFIAGNLGSITVAPELSLPVTIAGIVLFLFGMRVLKMLLFPISYLLLMIPMWEIITDRLHYPMQLFSATLGATLLQFVGVPVHRDATYIMLPNITLEVARECSGVNYLIAVVAIGIPLAYLFLRGWGRKCLLLCWGILIAVLGNGVRVALIGLFSYHGIGNNIHGPLHIFQGLSVAVVGYGALFSGLWVLTKNQPDIPQSNMIQNTHRFEQSIARKDTFNRLTEARSMGVVLCALILVSSKLFLTVYYPEPVELKNHLNTFPVEIGEWTGQDVPPLYKGFQELAVDHELSRMYRKKTGETLWFYIGYFDDQNQGKKLVSYKTEELFLDTTKTEVRLGGNHEIEVNKKVIMHNRQQGNLMLFWYEINGRIVSNKFMAKFYTAWDAITRKRTNGAVIMLMSDVNGREAVQEVFSKNEEFIQEIAPLLENYLPKA